MTPPQQVAVLRALQLGDMLCAVPALRALRTALPAARITLIGLPWARSFAERYAHLLDDFLALPGYPGLPEQPPAPERLPAFLSEVRARRFDLVLQMHGSGGVTNPLALQLGARQVAGYVGPGVTPPGPGRFFPYPAGIPEVRRHLALMTFLGFPAQGEHLEFPIHAADRAELAALPDARRLTAGSYVCLHPGARSPSRRWPVERFARVGDTLARWGLRVVLTGSEDEWPLTDAVAGRMRAPALNLAGRTSLGGLAALLSGARLLVCNDTGVSHVAAALGTPSVVVVISSDPERWAPLDRVRHRVVRRVVDCNPCEHVICPIDHRCAGAVSAADVVAASAEQLRMAPPVSLTAAG